MNYTVDHMLTVSNIHLRIFLIFLIGFTLSISTFFVVNAWEEEHIQQTFQYAADSHAAAIRTEFESIEHLILLTRFLVEHDIHIEHDNPSDPNDFMPMSETTVINHPSLLSITWAIQTYDDTGQGHFKVIYIHKGNQAPSDYAPDIQLHAFYTDHLDNNVPFKERLTTAFIHSDNLIDSHELNFIAPVGQHLQTNSAFHGEPIGAIIFEWHLDRLLKNAMAKLPITAQDITLSLVNNQGDKKPVYFHPSHSRLPSEQKAHTGIKHTVPFDFSGSHWSLEFEATPAFLRQNPAVIAWQSLFVCLLISFFFTWYAYNSNKSRLLIQHKVIKRTQALRQSENKIRRIIDRMQDTYYRTDLEGNILEVSPSILNLAGYTPKELIHTPMANYYAHSKDQALFLTASNDSSADKILGNEAKMVCKGGHHIWVSINAQPIYDEQHHRVGIEGTIRNISDKRKNEIRLQKSKDHYQNLLEMTHAGILVHQQGKVMYANPYAAKCIGFTSPAELIGQDITAFIHPDDLADVLQRTNDTLKKDSFYNDAEERYIRTDSQIITFRVSAKRITFEGQPAVLVVGQDITEQKQVETQLQHIDRVESLGILAGGIAHDFNNLLTSILGHAALARHKLHDVSPTSQHLEAIIQASNSAADLCKQMLAYAGKGKFIIKPVNLSKLVKNMGKLLDVSLHKNTTLNYHLHEQLPSFPADVAQIQQIILNLMTNAAEAIGDQGGYISMNTGVFHVNKHYLSQCIGHDQLTAGRYIYLEIKDTGCGMSQATQQKIFDPFFTTKFTGRGLGMSAMLGTVKGHHGALHIQSKVGKGTTIKIIFPAPDTPDTPDTPKYSGTVLVIDDESIIRDIAYAMLEDLGFKVLTATDGQHGVEVFRQHMHDISFVLLDMTMPKMDGKACFKALQALQPHVKVILSSGYSEQEVTDLFIDHNLSGFLQKPYSPEKMATTVAEILSQTAKPTYNKS